MFNKETVMIFVFSLTVFVVANSALFYGILTTPDSLFFLGGHLPNSGEILSLVLPQIREGHLLTNNLFTSEFQPRIFFASSFLPLGLLGRFIPVSDLTLTLIGKFIYSFALFWLFWQYLRFSEYKKPEKILAMLLLGFSGGTGFLLKFFIPGSTDLIQPEANIFHSILYFPNVVYNQALLLLSFLTVLCYWKDKKAKYLIVGTISATLLAFEHQFSAATFLLTLFLIIGFAEKTLLPVLKRYFIYLPLFLFPTVCLLFQIWLIKHFPTVSAWTKQTSLNTNSLLSLISGFGIVGCLAFVQILKTSWEKSNLFTKINILWVCSSLLLMLSPLPFQRRFLEGIYLPICVLAAPALWRLLQTLNLKTQQIKLLSWLYRNKLFYFFVLLLLSSSNLFLIIQDAQAFQDHGNAASFYIYQVDKKGLDYLKLHSTENDLVLADGFYSTLIPGLIARPVYFGHNIGTVLTINPQKKTENAKKFFLEENDVYRQDFLKKNNIKFLFLGKKGSTADDFKTWDEKKYLKKIYEKDSVKIFRVNLPSF